MSLSDPDRKRLRGKAANRCALCNEPLTRPETPHDPEVVVGEEAHIVARSSGGPRYRPMDARTCAGYDNRILLCPTHHAEVDAQPQTWSEERLLKRKREHELLMGSRTSHGQRHGLVFERQPNDVGLPLLLSGAQVLAVTGGALAYDSGKEDLGTEAERDRAAELLQCAQDWGEIYGDIGPSGHLDAERSLDELLRLAMDEGLLLYGALLETTVRMGDDRMRWPVRVSPAAPRRKRCSRAARPARRHRLGICEPCDTRVGVPASSSGRPPASL